MRREEGFTLIEVLVALAITAILSLMGMASINSVMRTKDGLESTIESTQRLEMTRAIIRKDVSQLSRRVARDEFGTPSFSPFIGNDQTNENLLMSFVTAGRPSVGRSVHLPSLHFVEYIYRDNNLIRRTRPYIDAAPQHQFYERVLISEIDHAEIQFFSNNTWLDYWDFQTAVRERQPFPTAVWINFHHKKYGLLENRFFTNIQN